MSNEQLSSAIECEFFAQGSPSQGLSPYWMEAFTKGWQAALSQSSPQGVAEVMELAGNCCVNFLRSDHSYKNSKTALEQAITAIVTERDTLRADAARYRWLREFNIDSYLVAGSKEKLDRDIDHAIAASKEAK